MNYLRKIQMEKRMVEIEKDLAYWRKQFDEKEKDLSILERNALVGLIRNLIGQKARLEMAMGGGK